MKPLLRITALLLCLIGGSGCARKVWLERTLPTTEAERQQVLAHAEKILAATPHSLSGHDQDWDDAIAEAHRQARETVCRKTYWEFEPGFDGGHYNGRWKYAEAAPGEREKPGA